jgi:hypothetical protein
MANVRIVIGPSLDVRLLLVIFLSCRYNLRVFRRDFTSFSAVAQHAFVEKFNSASVLGWSPSISLIWEFSLNDVLKYIQNNSDIIKNGLAFQRTRGTREAVKIAANWADLDDVDIYPGYADFSWAEYSCASNIHGRDFVLEVPAENSTASTNARASNLCASYETNQYWSERKRPERPWNDEIYVAKLH